MLDQGYSETRPANGVLRTNTSVVEAQNETVNLLSEIEDRLKNLEGRLSSALLPGGPTEALADKDPRVPVQRMSELGCNLHSNVIRLKAIARHIADINERIDC